MNVKDFPSSTGLSLSAQLYSSNQSFVVIEVDPVWWRKASGHSKARLQHATELRRLLRVHGPLSGYDLYGEGIILQNIALVYVDHARFAEQLENLHPL